MPGWIWYNQKYHIRRFSRKESRQQYLKSAKIKRAASCGKARVSGRTGVICIDIQTYGVSAVMYIPAH